MKYFFGLLLALNAFLGLNRLSASEVEKYLTYFWSGNDEELYLNIDISNQLEFADNYIVFETTDGKGQGCEISCKPIQPGTIFSAKGYELNEIKLTVVLNNKDNPNQVSYTTITKGIFKGVSADGFLVSTTLESKRQGVLNNPAIDLTQSPDFFTIYNEPSKGFICFKNVFP